MSFEVVWFKRDLRVHDHAPLAKAAAFGPVIPLYIIEPSLLSGADYDPCHWTFAHRSLLALRESLAHLGQPLVVRQGECVDVLKSLHRTHPIVRLWSHEETGNGLTYARDRAVAKWARAENIEWREAPNGGVVRRLKSRDGWSRIWESRMTEAQSTPPALPKTEIEIGHLPAGPELGLVSDHRAMAQPGGETAAQDLLDSFLSGRGHGYHRAMSSPVTAFDGCSRLSPHLAYGTISTRQVVSRLRETISQTEAPGIRRALRAFDARLHWRDHFMQKLEDEPAIEFHNFVRGFDGLRESDHSEERFAAWAEGRTGYPMVDACMRCLHQTGWLNFRMRAMLMSFAAYDLWLHWRPAGLHLARLFVDYEPGIHWSQSQMQSGTTGMNTLRIYSPAKQQQDHDPEFAFIHRWIPELRENSGKYPPPIVDHAEAVKEARGRIAEFRRRRAVREEVQAVTEKHGSRKRAPRYRTGRRKPDQPILFEAEPGFSDAS
ncbi:MAG: deoxyribodipyrimidine photolyase [Acidobacteria bacterium]|nr:deoxyribodipyrimidine photolyase [Acidobacteriota bacterium]